MFMQEFAVEMAKKVGDSRDAKKSCCGHSGAAALRLSPSCMDIRIGIVLTITRLVVKERGANVIL